MNYKFVGVAFFGNLLSDTEKDMIEDIGHNIEKNIENYNEPFTMHGYTFSPAQRKNNDIVINVFNADNENVGFLLYAKNDRGVWI